MADVKDIFSDDLYSLMASVVHERKTYPKKILESEKKRFATEIKSLKEATVILRDNGSSKEVSLLCDETSLLLAEIPQDDTTTQSEIRLNKSSKNLEDIIDYIKLIKK